MSSEAVAKSVAGSLFHTCSDDPKRVQRAVEVLQILIDDFGVSNMFGRRNIQYFAEMTRTGKEKYRFEYRYPRDGSVPCKYLSCSAEEASRLLVSGANYLRTSVLFFLPFLVK